MNTSYKRTTIVFPRTEQGILLAMKKEGHGAGWWNGFGGKLEPGETYEEGAARESFEEGRIKVGELRHIANLHFFFNNVLGVVSKAYIADGFEGEPTETDEMRPQFFAEDQIPYDQMWPADRLWIPRALESPVPLGFIVRFTTEYGDNRVESVTRVPARRLEGKF